MNENVKKGIEAAKKKLLDNVDNPSYKEKMDEIIADEIEYEKLLTELEAVKRCTPLEQRKIEMLESKVKEMENYMISKYSKGSKIRRSLQYVSLGISIVALIVSINNLVNLQNSRNELERNVAYLERAIIEKSLGNDERYNKLTTVSWDGYADLVCISTLGTDKVLKLGQAIEYYFDDEYIMAELKRLVEERSFEGNIKLSSYMGDEITLEFFDSHVVYTYSSIFEVFELYNDFDNIIDEIENVIRNNALKQGRAVYWISSSEIEINYNNEINVYTLDEAREKFKDNDEILSQIEKIANERLVSDIKDESERTVRIYWINDKEMKIEVDGTEYVGNPHDLYLLFKDDEYIVSRINNIVRSEKFKKDINSSVLEPVLSDNDLATPIGNNDAIIEIPDAVYEVADNNEQIKAFEAIYNTLENELVYDEVYADAQKRMDLENRLSAYEIKQKDIERTKTDKRGVCTTFAMRLSDELDKLGMTNYMFYSIDPDGMVHWANLYLVDDEYFVADITNDIVQGNYARELFGDFGRLPALSYNIPLSTYMKEGSVYYIVEPIKNDKRVMSEYSVLPMDAFINQLGVETSQSSSFGR